MQNNDDKSYINAEMAATVVKIEKLSLSI